LDIFVLNIYPLLVLTLFYDLIELYEVIENFFDKNLSKSKLSDFWTKVRDHKF